mgnify:CR=1 FL=1
MPRFPTVGIPDSVQFRTGRLVHLRDPLAGSVARPIPPTRERSGAGMIPIGWHPILRRRIHSRFPETSEQVSASQRGSSWQD